MLGRLRLEDFRSCAKAASLKRGRAETILREVRAIVSRWPDYAEEVGVNPVQRDQIHRTLRLDDF